MTGLDRLYKYAKGKKIFVYFGQIGFSNAITVKEFDDSYYVALNSNNFGSEAEEQVILMHEFSHIATGTFYNNNHDILYRHKMENIATRWQIEYMIPKEKLEEAIHNGYTEIWDLADYFEVTEDFVKKAVEYYKIA